VPLPPDRLLTGHTDGVHTVAFSPDGKRIVTASHDGTARVWDAASGKALHVLEGHGEPVYAAAFSDEGERVATCAGDGRVFVWDVESGELLAMLEGHLGVVVAVAFAPDGTVISAGQDGTLRRWHVDSERQVWGARVGSRPVNCLAVSPDGTLLATGNDLPAVTVWDLSSGRPKWRSRAPITDEAEQELRARQQREAGHEPAPADEDDDETASVPPDGERRPVTNLVFSRDGSRLFTQQFFANVHEWDAATGRLVTRHEPGRGALAIDVSPDGRWLLIGAVDALRVWNARTNPLEMVATLEVQQPRELHDVAFSPDGRFATAAYGGQFGMRQTWESPGPTPVPVWDLSRFGPGPATSPATSPSK
jgi:WD40 repeat protein